MEYLLVISGRLDGLNDYIKAERTSKYKAAQMKYENETVVLYAAQNCLKDIHIRRPVYMEYIWYEKDRRRDMDNISSFGRKVIQDALVRGGFIKNDGWKEILGFSDTFQIDRKNPRIEVFIREINVDT